MRTIRLLIVWTLLALGAAPAATQDGRAGDQLAVYLLTMGTGDMVWEKYGHNAIWIHDPAAGSDWVFNYGVFDFDSPGYWSRFIAGDWLYQLAVSDIGQTLAQYEYLNRTIVAQELALTPAQKTELAAFLEWNYRPENREYLYDYFRDNCSTRIRDAIDRVLGGRLRTATDTVPSGSTFRSHSRRLMADDPVVYTGLHAGLGPASDRPISQWEEMFLPEKVRERVAELQVVGEDGSLRPLVTSERVLYRAVNRAPDRQAPPRWTLRFLGVGLAIAAILVLLARSAARNRGVRFGFAVLGGVWTLVIGIGGVLLLGLWFFTNHTIADRNENLLQFVPLALPLVVLLPAAVLGASWARRPARLLALAVAAISVFGLLVQILPWFDQVNGEIIALLLPPNLALAWGAHRRLTTATDDRRPRPATESTMPIQIFGTMKCKSTQKALRFFKERRVQVHFVDLAQKAASPRELERFARKFGTEALLDREGKRFRDRGLHVSHLPESRIIPLLVEDPLLVRTPLVRAGNVVAIGLAEAEWKAMAAGV